MGDLSVLLGDNVFNDAHCFGAWGEVGTAALMGIIDAVRNRVLEFSIELWKKEPTLGAPGLPLKPEARDVATQIFQTFVTGGMANVVGSAHQSNLSFEFGRGDMAALTALLAENGVSRTDIADLASALQAEPTTRQGAFGQRVAGWIAKMVAKAADGSWNIGIGAAGELLAQALSKYYGM